MNSSSSTAPPSSNVAKETFFGLLCGLSFGLTSAIVGQPLDVVKTRLQCDPLYQNATFRSILKQMARQEGIRGFYSGLAGPLVGSLIFRSLQFGVFNGSVEFLKEQNIGGRSIIGTDIKFRLIFSAIAAGTVRSIIETPLELYKVRRMVGDPAPFARPWFRGFAATVANRSLLLTTFFTVVDVAQRNFPDQTLGPFFSGGVAASTAWIVCWPLEIAKNQIAANNSGGPTSIHGRLMHIFKNHGLKGFSRGIVPGLLRSLVANGASFAVYSSCQERRKQWQSVDNE